MPKTTEPAQVLVVTKDSLIAQSVQSAFSKESDFKLLDSSYLSEGIIRAIQILEPDIVLIDYNFDPEGIYDTIDDIAMKFSNIAVVVILPETEIHNSNRVILAGARAFLLNPFSQINLLSTLRRIRELSSRMATSQAQSGSGAIITSASKTYVVFSPKGGVGCTTVATNLAIALYQVLGEEVLLVDGKHLFGDVALMLNLRTANSIADLIPHAGSLDDNLIRQVVSQHVSGIHVLPCPFSISVAQGIRADDIYRVILGLQRAYTNVVVDGGSNLSDEVVTYMDAAFRVILVMNPDLASLRDARQFLDICRTLSYPHEKILLLLNNVGRKAELGLADIEKVLRTKVFGMIPSDDNIALSCVNEGIPIILKKSNHAISKTYRKVAKDLAEMSSASLATSEKSFEVLSKTSRLG